MKTRKLKLEFYDNDGTRHSVTMDGPVNREKLGKLLDLVEIMTGRPDLEPIALGASPHKYDRLTSLVLTRLKGTMFKASDARKKFEETFNEKITMSTVSTYLSRLADKGIIERVQEGPSVSYLIRQAEGRLPLSPLRTLPSPASTPDLPE